MMMPVDPETMTPPPPLIRGLPEPLKSMDIQFQGQIVNLTNGERTVVALEGDITPDHICREHKSGLREK